MKTVEISFLSLLIVGFTFCLTGCGEHPPKEVNQPRAIISKERAHDMYKAYTPLYDSITEIREGVPDARYGWNSLDFYKNYIAYIEQEAEKKGIKVSGLRLYFSSYPDDDKSGKQKGYQTYFFVPTYFDSAANKHIAFDTYYTNEKGLLLPIHDYIVNGPEGGENGMEKRSASNEEESLIANMGEMCPINCPEGI